MPAMTLAMVAPSSSKPPCVVPADCDRRGEHRHRAFSRMPDRMPPVGGAGPAVKFVRVGTLDEPDRVPPDLHIFTSSKQPWVVIPPDHPSVPEYYDRNAYWPARSLERRQALLPLIEAWKARSRPSKS